MNSSAQICIKHPWYRVTKAFEALSWVTTYQTSSLKKSNIEEMFTYIYYFHIKIQKWVFFLNYVLMEFL